jgi:hypothetical protein
MNAVTEGFAQSDLRDTVIRLDMLLTGKSQGDAERTARNQARLLTSPEPFLTTNDAYYLSDGGYSRVKANEETGRLALLSQSRAEVKARWTQPEVRRAIQAVEQVLRDFLVLMGLLDDEEDERYADLPLSSAITAVAPQIAAAAQTVYDAWDQSDPENDDLNGGGICHLIADEAASILSRVNIPCATQCSSHEQHVYVVAQCRDGVFEVDIPHRLYERGGGFTWTKIEGVRFAPDDIVMSRLDGDPAKMADYVDEWQED